MTAWPGGSPSSGNTYSFYDFDGGTSGTLLTGDNLTFIGCRFQSNSVANINVQATGTNIRFSYCSFTPRVAVAPVIPRAAWPSAGAGLQINGTGGDYASYMIGGNDGYQYGINVTAGGPVTIDHCDIWGFGNSIVFYSTTAQMIVSNCWIHDPANGDLQSYHTDGPGYLNGGTPPQNVTIIGNTIAGIPPSTAANCIAFQAATSPYANIRVIRNYLTGYGYCVDMCHNVASSTGLIFTDNTIATDNPWIFGPIYADFSTMFTQASNPTNLWRRNRFKVLPGTSPIAGSVFSFTTADDGKFILPNATVNATDWSS